MKSPRAGGFTLVSAIFLMVVLVVLGASLATLSSVAQTTSAQQVQQARANYAVRTGIEWAVSEAGTAGCNGGATLTPGGTLSGFTVSVTCTSTNHSLPPLTEGAGVSTQQYIVVDVKASSGTYGTTDYVLRRGQAKLLGPHT